MPGTNATLPAPPRHAVPEGTTLWTTAGGIAIYHRHVNIGDYGPGLASIAQIACSAAEFLLEDIEKERLHCYVNPSWIVTASGSADVKTFLKQADVCCVRWKTHLRHTLGNGPVKRMLRTMDANAGCLATCGVLFVSGREAYIKRLNWRANRPTR